MGVRSSRAFDTLTGINPGGGASQASWKTLPGITPPVPPACIFILYSIFLLQSPPRPSGRPRRGAS